MRHVPFVTILLCSELLASRCHAIVASFWWEVSTNGGSTWTASAVQVPSTQTSVRLRGRAGWTTDSVRRIFDRAFFDAVVTFDAGVGDNDSVPMMSYERMFWETHPVQPIRYGNYIKIDDPSDTAPPGEGPRGLTPTQPTPDFGYEPDSNNPCTVFSFTLNFDGSLGRRSVSAAMMLPLDGPSAPGQFIHVWKLEVGPGGGTPVERLDTTVAPPLEITVVPAPSAALLLGLAGMGARRTRRSEALNG